MNASGEALAALGEREALRAPGLLVICDDVNLPLGRLRVRRGGSDGGHNGLLSVTLALGTTEYPRLRLGVGPRPPETTLHDFVLGEFGEDEAARAEALVERGALAALAFAERGIEAAMREHNADVAGTAGGETDERG
jgi:PTH1 family peptidyl-tRNA hydrolase